MSWWKKAAVRTVVAVIKPAVTNIISDSSDAVKRSMAEHDLNYLSGLVNTENVQKELELGMSKVIEDIGKKLDIPKIDPVRQAMLAYSAELQKKFIADVPNPELSVMNTYLRRAEDRVKTIKSQRG